ncbi:unnamed protein product [Staurois parvus]|uniref:Uncharacterized protein n=1 Tax=Staurois parvus TaxID=386267 RepID=A0ABN9G7N0_9NEOB|nr:unnamed protein product [Staurois parvus]
MLQKNVRDCRHTTGDCQSLWACCSLERHHKIYFSLCTIDRGGLTIWKLGHCPRARGQ